MDAQELSRNRLRQWREWMLAYEAEDHEPPTDEEIRGAKADDAYARWVDEERG